MSRLADEDALSSSPGRQPGGWESFHFDQSSVSAALRPEAIRQKEPVSLFLARGVLRRSLRGKDACRIATRPRWKKAREVPLKATQARGDLAGHVAD